MCSWQLEHKELFRSLGLQWPCDLFMLHVNGNEHGGQSNFSCMLQRDYLPAHPQPQTR